MVHITLSMIIIIVLVIAIAFLLGSGTISLGPRTTITSPEQASDRTVGIGSGTEEISSALTDIENRLG